MTRSQFFLISSVIFLLSIQFGCQTSTESGPAVWAKACQIHLRSSFSNTPVTVTLDNAQVFSDTVSTNQNIGYARKIPVQVINGTHFLRVTVSQTIAKDTSFTVQDTLYIGVYFTETDSAIEYYFSREQFVYD